VLSGPQALVAARPPSDEVAQKLSSVWADVVAATDLESLVSRLMHWGLDVVPDLIVIVDDNGLSCVVRGLLTVRDADDGNVVADGRGQTAWRAAMLRTRHIIIDLPGETPGGVHLPLAVGVVSASSIEVDARDGARVDVGEGLSFPAPLPGEASPQLRIVPDLAPAPVTPSVPHPAVMPMPVPEPVVAPQMAPEPEPTMMRQPMPEQAPQPMPQQQATVAQLWGQPQQMPDQAPQQQAPMAQPAQQMPMQQQPAIPDPGMQQMPMAGPGPDYPMDQNAQPGVNEDGRFVRQFIPSGPLPVGEAAQMMAQMAPQQAPQMAPQQAPQMSPQMAPQQAQQMGPQAGPPGGQDPDRYDWWQPEPEPAPEQVYRQGPPPMSEPPVVNQQNDYAAPTGATELDFVDGQRVPVGDPILVGRAPQAYPGEDARLVRVASPHHDISRTHVRIELYDGAVWATDRDSTNGTVIHNPGQDPIAANPNQPVHVWVGGVIDIGDGMMIRVR